jgi:2,3-bisphosphoglycerate-independent phosphoglycerate mutase
MSTARSQDRPVALVVLDGWGYRREREGNAVALANTPAWDALWARRSRTLLHASGLPVGLPEGQMGNSEVGHLNLGAGRVVMQDIVRISESIRDGSFHRTPAFVDACAHVKRTGGTLHLLGLLGAGGVHGLDRHLFALVDLAEREGVPRVAIHAMLDGRDTLPKSGLGYLQQTLDRVGGRAAVASIGGRYYGMDRDKRWPRTELAYRAMVDGTAPPASDASAPCAPPTTPAPPTSSSSPPPSSTPTAARPRRCATATRWSAGTTAATACGRSSARSPTRRSTGSTCRAGRGSSSSP